MFVTALSSFPAVAIVFIICPITFRPTGKGLTKDLQDQLVKNLYSQVEYVLLLGLSWQFDRYLSGKST